MEAFSLLKYWKAAGGGSAGAGRLAYSSGTDAGNGTILSALSDHSDSDYGDDDEGSFFDLEFAVAAEDEDGGIEKLERENDEIVNVDGDEDDYDGGGERELDFRELSPTTTSTCENSSNANVDFSPSDDLLFDGRIVQIDGSEDEEMTSKSGQFPIPVSLLRSATKFRVFMLGLKRSKSESTTAKSQPLKQNQQQNNNNSNINRKLFTVKFKVEEVPVISLLSRAASNSKTNTVTATAGEDAAPVGSDSGQEKRNRKEVIMQKYLKLHRRNIRASKRNQEAQPETVTEERENAAEAVWRREMKGQKVIQGLNMKGIMMASKTKHLGKSKSAVVYSTMQQNAASNRRDDSLLQQQDGIQGAILHCKRSFNSSAPDLEEREESESGQVLTRSVSDPSHEKKRTTTATESAREKDKNADDVVSVNN